MVCGPAADRLYGRLVELLGRPAHHRAESLRDSSRLHAGVRRQHLALTVAIDEIDGNLTREQERERLSRHRSRYHVPTNDDPIDTLAPHRAQHGLERGQVAVDVVQRGKAHPLASA
jgi:hypothetical protein